MHGYILDFGLRSFYAVRTKKKLGHNAYGVCPGEMPDPKRQR
jgi:hypothetical protein